MNRKQNKLKKLFRRHDLLVSNLKGMEKTEDNKKLRMKMEMQMLDIQVKVHQLKGGA